MKKLEPMITQRVKHKKKKYNKAILFIYLFIIFYNFLEKKKKFYFNNLHNYNLFLHVVINWLKMTTYSLHQRADAR